ncbi:S-formylglutathione hydrolase [Tropicimonas sp. IMCC6043]|uniref:S-formylglutathione hydrolase n=1 Tax=Tropicimonas sp. IMCC6043 TaxID=2510645 RepID=UPI00101CF461|nr:S-formylglutathione hydrolase [Tropicimonas sp. IMCC6043]RYH10953.1 S-formylglutathione hydrolase [Tropicimonas sp. IMCC6043]
METLSENRCFGGTQGVYTHRSDACACDMTFGLYLPPQAARGPVPLLWFLAGLTCTHENAMVKTGAQAHAARHGLALVFPDTSPRGDEVTDDDAYDLGQGAGFYVDATREPWAPNFSMWSYIAQDLTAALASDFPLDMERQGITGHSMGGHGALTLAMGLPGRFGSVSALAPIAHPSASDWGRKQLTAYLGADEAGWAAHDSTLQMRAVGLDVPVLVDQGSEDQFLDLLKPEALAEAMAARRQPGAFRVQAGYDHSYFFVSTFMGDHVAFHAAALGLS